MSILGILQTALDAILPRRERRKRTETRTLLDIPIFPLTTTLLDTEILTVMDYRERAVEDLIRSLKYDHSGHAAKLCANIIEDYLREEIASVRVFSSRRIILVPVPLHSDRARERGFNQIEAVLRHLPAEFHDRRLSSVAPLLKRVRATKQQTNLSRKERLQNVAGAFELLDPKSFQDAHVFLIDDVATTGATLVEASRPFTAHAIPITLLALGRA